MSSAPTGRQHEIRRGDHVATVVEVGAGLRSYTEGSRPILDGYGAGDRIDAGRGQLLVPWPNRIRGGRYPWDGAELQLPLNEVAKNNASHGLLRWTSWHLLDRADDRVRLGVHLWPQPGYPFHLEVAVDYALTDEGLSVALSASNVGETPAPYGAGQHPYLTAGTHLVDDATLTVPATRRIVVDERGLPTGTEPVAGTAYDFRSPRPIGGQSLDTAYGDLERTADGRCVVRLEDPATSTGVDLWLGEGTRYVQLFTGETLPDPARRRRGIAVEPMTCPADAYRSGEGLVTLDPGATHTMRWGLTPFTNA